MANKATLIAQTCRRAIDIARHEPKFDFLPVPITKSFLGKGLARGVIAEITGKRSSGRTSLASNVLAQATAKGEICALVDLHNSFDPESASDAGVGLDRLVWVRCSGNAEHAMRAADLLLHAGGFGVVLLDLCDASPRVLNRIPISYWHRFRRAIEHTPTILLVCAEASQAKSSSSATLHLDRIGCLWSGLAPFLLLRGFDLNARSKSIPVAPAAVSVKVA